MSQNKILENGKKTIFINLIPIVVISYCEKVHKVYVKHLIKLNFLKKLLIVFKFIQLVGSVKSS